jgi:hypothetical protein
MIIPKYRNQALVKGILLYGAETWTDRVPSQVYL